VTASLDAYVAAIMADFGYREGVNNYTKFGVWYGAQVGNPAFGNAAWCDMATSYWADKVGAADIVGRFAWTPSHAQWFVNRGQWSNLPVRGGIAFWDWAGSNSISAIDHVSALIESVDSDGQAVTIDANYADRVDRWRHPMRYFVGCGLPAWSTGAYRPPIDVPAWDGRSFPGADKFGPGQVGPWITFMGQQMQRLGLGGYYKVGPSPDWGTADRDAYAAWQRFLGYTGADADGIPGPTSWQKMLDAKDGAARSTPPPPPPPPPADTRPWISLSRVIDSARRDGPAPQGWAAHRSDALLVERALAAVGLPPGPVDGSFGTMAVAAYARWQRTLGYTGRDADGIPGLSSLQTLGDRTGLFRVAG
jgi:hypothetical protein